MRKIFLSLVCTAAAVILAGCAKEISVEEVLQLPIHEKIYTTCNIWYEDPMNIDCRNNLKGSILPFGTQVEIIKATEAEVHFRRADDGTEFCIEFDPEIRMESMQEYIKEIFSDKNAENLTEGIRLINIEKVRRGMISKGMTKKEVRLAYGPPCKSKTPSEALDTWIYWTEYLISKRLVFNNNALTDVIE